MVQTKLFSDLFLAKFLDSSTKSFFLCTYNFQYAYIINVQIKRRLRNIF